MSQAALAYLALGLVVAIAVLPWQSPRTPVILTVAAWTVFWPLLLLIALPVLVRLYMQAWCRFADRARRPGKGLHRP